VPRDLVGLAALDDAGIGRATATANTTPLSRLRLVLFVGRATRADANTCAVGWLSACSTAIESGQSSRPSISSSSHHAALDSLCRRAKGCEIGSVIPITRCHAASPNQVQAIFCWLGGTEADRPVTPPTRTAAQAATTVAYRPRPLQSQDRRDGRYGPAAPRSQ
jgi:hypothetical protein